MKSILISNTDSIPKIDTVSYETTTHVQQNLPHSPLRLNEHLTSELVYTIIFMIVFAFVRLKGKDLFHNLLNILLKRKKVEIVLNEGISSNLICYILSLVLSFSVISGCISSVICESFLSIYTIYLFIALLLYHFALIIIVHLFCWAFNSKNIASEIAVNLWTFHIIIGLAIAPFVLSSFFVQNFAIAPLLKITALSLVLLIAVKFIRWIVILFAYRVSILYMILYLCAFEIIPLLVLYKIVA